MTASSTQHPAVVPLRPVDTSGLFAGQDAIVYGSYDDGEPAAAQLSGTDAPHFLITGPAGSGLTTVLRDLAIGGARIGCDVRICDPRRLGMIGLRGWPNVTAVATTVKEMITLIEDAYDEMVGRYEAVYEPIGEEGARPGGYQRILLIIDAYRVLSMLIRDYWDWARAGLPGGHLEEHPVMGKLRSVAAMARGSQMNLILGSDRPNVKVWRDQFGGRVALGRQTEESAELMFGDASAGRDIPLCAPGVATAATASGPRRVRIGWLPDPARYPDDFRPEDGDPRAQRDLLLAMLPAGATWDGPWRENR